MSTDHKIELSAEQFVRLIQTGKATAKRGLVQIAELKQIQNETVRFIHNIVVDENIKLEKLECIYRIHIVDCSFKDIWIEGCNFQGGFKIESSDIQKDFGVKDTVIEMDLSIISSDIHRSINIVWGAVFENFLINTTNVMDNFFMNNGKVTHDFQIFYSEFKNRFQLYNNCSIGGQCIIDHVTAIDIKISQLKVLKDCRIWYNKFNGSIDIERSELYSLNFLSITATGISVFETIISDRFIIQLNSIDNNIFIIKTTVSNELIINDTTRKELSIIESNLNILNISSLSEKISLHISHTFFTKIQASGAINLGYLQWNNLIPKDNAIIEITNSLMGKWDIINCNFDDVKMIIYSSKVTDAFYTNTKFPKELTSPQKIKKAYLEGDVIEYEEIENKHEILRDGYNQLKTLAQKQNDRGMYLHYQAAELRSFHETLKGDKKHRATRFQLWAMSISNNYGTSWWKGVRFVAGVNLLFVIVCFGFRKPQFDCSGIGNFFNLYLSSLSLISIPKILSPESNWEMNWFYISRIPLAFGIYQTIAAFRKFGKSE